MPAPNFVAEVVSPGGESSDSYQRDYVWKRQQYEALQIPEYWIIDPHRDQVTVLTLIDKAYVEQTFSGDERIVSKLYPALALKANELLTGQV